MDNNTFENTPTFSPDPTPPPAPNPAPAPAPTPIAPTETGPLGTPAPVAPTETPPPTPITAETPASNVTASAPTSATPKPKSKKLIIIIIVALIITAVIVAAIFLLPKLFSANSDDETSLEDSVTKTNSFFIRDGQKGNYALFDIEGNKLTDFIFEEYDTFANGATAVVNADGKYGIIDTNGKMVVDFGTCNYIYQEGSLYQCTTDDGYKLLDAKGKTILTADYLDADSPIGYHLFTLVLVEAKDKEATYIAYDYKGNEITSFPANKKSIFSDVDMSSEGDFVTVFSDNTSYFFNAAKSKLLFTLNDDTQYCIQSVNDVKPNEFIVDNCAYGSASNQEFKLIRDDKVAYSKPGGDGYDLYFENGAVIYSAPGEDYLLDDAGDQVADYRHTEFTDNKNFITQDDKATKTTANLYINGEKKQQVSCQVSDIPAFQGIYILHQCKDLDKGSEIYMKKDGTILNKASYKYASAFDENGFATVSEDGKESYLINTDGDTVSPKFTSKSGSYQHITNIPGTKDFYYASNSDGTESVFKVGGDIIVTGDDIIYYSVDRDQDNICVIVQKGESYTVYNLTANKELTSVAKQPRFGQYYFTVDDGDKTQYYSYINGKMFHEGTD